MFYLLQEFSLFFTLDKAIYSRYFTITVCVCALEASYLLHLVYTRVILADLDGFRVHELFARNLVSLRLIFFLKTDLLCLQLLMCRLVIHFNLSSVFSCPANHLVANDEVGVDVDVF